MKILVVGNGAREHALTWALTRNTSVTVVCAPGNPGMAALARCIPVDAGNPTEVLEMVSSESVDLTIVGPELPLSRGIVDVFRAAGRPIIGPSRQAAALEWSKVFAKDFMARHGVPTAHYRVCASAQEALATVDRGEFGYPLVVKADGLAWGKGVIIAEDRPAAVSAIEALMSERRFGAAGDRVVLEEFMAGQEASYFVLADGARYVVLGSAQDHKRIFDNDRGPNTGGMGAFAPSPLLTDATERQLLDRIVGPVLAGMAQEGHPYTGFLYVGLMLSAAGPRVVEFNVRFGDPEAQVILPMLEEDLASLLLDAAAGGLRERPVRFRPQPHVGVVLATAGYPESARTGDVIHGLDAAGSTPDALVFHASTRRQDDTIVTDGGRVLTVVGRGSTYQTAIDVAYRAASAIRFDGMHMRRDIGVKALGSGRLGV